MDKVTSARRELLKGCLGLSVAGIAWPIGAAIRECSITQQDDLGPFYLRNAPVRSTIAGPDEPGDRTFMSGRVLAADCATPLAGALLDIWHADVHGQYHGAQEQYRLRGQVRCDKDGYYAFNSIRPAAYQFEKGLWRPAHFHFLVSFPGYEPLTTQLYFKGDPHLRPHDDCGDACKSGDPGRIIELKSTEADGRSQLNGLFDIVLRPKSA